MSRTRRWEARCRRHARRMSALLGLLLGLAPWASSFELSGIVRDATDQPVAGATVWLDQNRNPQKTETDASGGFRFKEVQVGPAELVAFKNGHALTGFGGIAVGSDTIPLRLGGSVGQVRLRITNPAREPVAGARIKSMVVGDAFRVSVEDLALSGFPLERSDADGRITVSNLAEGTHIRFIVSHPEYADTLVAFLPTSDKLQGITLYSGLTLRGRVTADGKGIGRTRVSIYRMTTAGQQEFAESLTDIEGFYTARVEPGEYFVAAKHPSYASPEPKPAQLTKEGDANAVDLELQAPCVVTGCVVGPEKSPSFGGMLVNFRKKDIVYDETFTQPDGAFRLQAPPGDGVVRVFPPPGFMTAGLPDMPARLEKGKNLDLGPVRLKALPEIQGTVRDADGKPAAKTLIASRNLDPPAWVLTDEKGQFRLMLAYAPREDQAAFRAEHGLRFQRADFVVNLKEPKPAEVNLAAFDPATEPGAPPPGGNALEGLVGKEAPAIACDAWFNSAPLTLAALRGKVIVMVFWGGFDRRPECFNQIEEMRALYDLLKDVEDIAFLGIHDSSTEQAGTGDFVKQYRVAFPVGHDASPYRTFEQYHIRYIPQVVLIDKQGVLRYYQAQGRLLELIKVLRRKN